MLYIYWGTDTKKTGDAIALAVDALRKRAPDAAIERITEEAETIAVDALLRSNGLFHAARVVIFDGVFAQSGHRDEILDRLPEIAESSHVFFIREQKLSAAELKKLEPYAKKVTQHDAKAKASAPFNSFALADALLARDKKRLWLTLIEALRAGSAAEELHGILFWGAKNLLLAKSAGSASAAGLSPFVYAKASRAEARFSDDEARAFVASLAALPHESRRNGVELEYALEQFALAL